MKRWIWIVVVVVVVLFFWLRRGHRMAPDEQLADRLDGICKIAEDYTDRPAAGVDQLFGYLGRESPKMLKDLGDTFVTIERIDDDDAHHERALLAGKRIRAPFVRCAGDLQRFGQAIEHDPDAAAKMQHGVERFAATLQLMFGNGGAALLPAELEHLVLPAAATTGR